MTHTLVPECPRAILLDLENIEKLFAEKTNEAAQANKAKVATAAKANERVPKKRTHGGWPDTGAPKKGRTIKYCKWCKAVDEPFTTHNTDECRRFNKDGSQKDRPTKPFDSARKPAGGDSSQMAYLTKEMTKMTKLLKKLRKSKKHSKKRARDSSDSDSDSD